MPKQKTPSAKRRQGQVIGADAGTPPTSASNADNPNVTYSRQEIEAMRYKWTLVRDCLQGQARIKEQRTMYLPAPLNDPDPVERQARYDQYVQRAQFYNFTRRTLEGLIGQVFSRDPILHASPYLVKLSPDIDGAGTSLDQQAKKALGLVLSYGRFGALADYPARTQAATMQEIQSLKVRPSIQIYAPWQVINWREAVEDGNTVYNLIVIQEASEDCNDGFELTYTDQWRVLRMVGGEYVCEVWRKDALDVAYLYSGPMRPKDANGKPITKIPFRFGGSISNNSSCDEPPLYDLAEINIGHYRNSADYEEACFIMGQPTAVFTGLTKEWVEQVWKGTVYIGSRAAIPLPANADGKLLQANANTMPFEAMRHKEAQAVAMGAQLIRESGVQKTLGESQNDSQSNSSFLATCAKNVSAVYTWLLPYLEAFALGDALRVADPESADRIFYDLNTDFPATRMTPNERTQLIAEWMDGAITFGEMRDGLRKAGIATLTTEKAQEELAANPSPNEKKLAMETELAKAGLEQKQQQAEAKNNDPQKPNNAPSGGNQAGN